MCLISLPLLKSCVLRGRPGLRFLLLTAGLLFLPAQTITWHKGFDQETSTCSNAEACVWLRAIYAVLLYIRTAVDYSQHMINFWKGLVSSKNLNKRDKRVMFSSFSTTTTEVQMTNMLFTLLLQFLAEENCGFTGQHPGVNVCNICMNVKQGVAGKEQRSAILSWINTGMKLEGTQQRTNIHQHWMHLRSGSFYKSLFVYCLSSGFDFLTTTTKKACECSFVQPTTWKAWMSDFLIST